MLVRWSFIRGGCSSVGGRPSSLYASPSCSISFTRGDLLADGFAEMAIMDHHLSLGVALSNDRSWLRRVRGVTDAIGVLQFLV